MAPIPQEELWRCFFARAPYAAVATDGNGVVQECNSNFLRLLGYVRSAVVGKHYREFVSNFDANTIDTELQRLSEGQSDPTTTGFMLMQHKDPNRGSVYADFVCWRIPVSGPATHILIICFEKSENSVRRDIATRPGLGRMFAERLITQKNAPLLFLALVVGIITGRLGGVFDMIVKLITGNPQP